MNRRKKFSSRSKAVKEEDLKIVFRERKLRDALKSLKHPKPIPGYKATLPGPPGWQAKERPGA